MNATTDEAETLVREIPFRSDGEVRVILASGELRIRGVDGETVRVRSIDDLPVGRAVRIVESDGLVDIRGLDGTDGSIGSMEIGGRGSVDLVVEVPRAVRVVARTASGDITADGLTGETHWASASGDVFLDLDGGVVSFETMSGDVELRTTRELTLDGRSVSGDVTIAAPRISALRIGTTSGDLRIEGAFDAGPHTVETISGDTRIATASGLRVEATTVAGDVRVSGRERIDEGGSTFRIGDGAAALRWRSMSGDLTVLASSPVAPTPSAAPTPPAPPFPEPVVVAEATAAPNLVRPATAGPASEPSAAIEDRATARRIRTERQEAARLGVLHAVERGELSIDEAAVRLAAVDDVTLSGGGAV